MWGDLIWAVAFVAVCGILFYLCNNRAKEGIEIRRNKQSFCEDEQRVKLEERKNTAKLDAATADERAEQEKARLRRETAEARAAAKVAEEPGTIAALAAEEEQVIAARAEGRAIAAKERAASEHSDSNVLPALVDAYKAYLSNGGSATRYTTFERWLGDIDVDDLR